MPVRLTKTWRSIFRLVDTGVPSKELDFDISSVADETIRTITMPNANVDLTSIAGSGYVVVTDAATYTVTAANRGKVHIIPDLTADCVLSLPAAADGLRYEFWYGGVAADAQDWQFDTGADANFYLGGLVQHDPDNAGDDTVVYYPDGDSNSKVNILTPEAGTVVRMFCNGTNWYLNGTVISATDAGVTWADQ